MVVAKWDTCDLSRNRDVSDDVDWKKVHLHETVKEGVAVHVGDVVAMGGVVVREEGDAGHFLMMTRIMMMMLVMMLMMMITTLCR